MSDIKFNMTMNFRREWNAEIGNDTVYMKFIIDSCLSVPRILLLISDFERPGFRSASAKPASGFSLNFTLRRMEKVGVFFKEDTTYRCVPTQFSYMEGCRMYEVSEELVSDTILDWNNPLSFNLGNPWYKNGSVDISRENMPEYRLYRSIVDRLTNKAKKTDYFKEYIDPKNKLLLRDTNNRCLYQVDHKFSVWQGFYDDLPHELVASLANLEILPWADNSSKGKKCSITIGKLLAEHSKLKEIGDE